MKYVILMSMSIVVAYASDDQKNVPHIKVDRSEPVAIPRRKTSQRNDSPDFVELNNFAEGFSPNASPTSAIFLNALNTWFDNANNSPRTSSNH